MFENRDDRNVFDGIMTVQYFLFASESVSHKCSSFLDAYLAWTIPRTLALHVCNLPPGLTPYLG